MAASRSSDGRNDVTESHVGELSPFSDEGRRGAVTVQVQFRHSWADGMGSGLNSTCSRCSSLIAANMDEFALMAFEQKHHCLHDDDVPKVAAHNKVVAPIEDSSESAR